MRCGCASVNTNTPVSVRPTYRMRGAAAVAPNPGEPHTKPTGPAQGGEGPLAAMLGELLLHSGCGTESLRMSVGKWASSGLGDLAS